LRRHEVAQERRGVPAVKSTQTGFESCPHATVLALMPSADGVK
jgi:hypothetical protein